ncbi:hypothetical protein T439DRAFT_383717 [Meredithblackwellia eburnea MCA 4105]
MSQASGIVSAAGSLGRVNLTGFKLQVNYRLPRTEWLMTHMDWLVWIPYGLPLPKLNRLLLDLYSAFRHTTAGLGHKLGIAPECSTLSVIYQYALECFGKIELLNKAWFSKYQYVMMMWAKVLVPTGNTLTWGPNPIVYVLPENRNRTLHPRSCPFGPNVVIPEPLTDVGADQLWGRKNFWESNSPIIQESAKLLIVNERSLRKARHEARLLPYTPQARARRHQ